MSDLVLYERKEAIVTLTLNRPDERNPISDGDMIEALLAALARLDDDVDARVALLTGAGAAFCAGGNVKRLGVGAGVSDILPVRTRRNYRNGIQCLPTAFAALETPIIAVVNGPAVGAGCDLACMCDLRIAGESAWFAESFVKLGLISGDGGAWFLPQAIGFAKAAEMALTGDRVDAREALAIGLVSSVVPDDQLTAAAERLAGRIAVNAPHAVRMTKRLLWQSRPISLESSLEMAAAMQALAHATADHAEGMEALIGKRTPCFTGL